MANGEEQNFIEGSVSTVIYQSEESGYAVLRLEAGESGDVTVVGTIPGIMPGEQLRVGGQWTRHHAYGEQFKAETVERRMPTGEKAVFEFLASGAVRGVGAATARRIVEEFGAETFTVLEERPELLTAIKGMNRKRALAIGEEFRLRMGMRRLMEFLGEHGVSLALAMPLYRRYGERALEVTRGNPYLLVDDELGVPFQTADKLALATGVSAEAHERMEAGLLFELAHNSGNGHTFLPRGKLLEATAQLLSVEPEALAERVEALAARGEIIEDTVYGEEACYLSEFYQAEVYVAFRIAEMSGNLLLPPDNLAESIRRMEEEQGITYAPQQIEAVELAARRQVMLLTGGPGTGKTTCLRAVLALFDSMGLDTALTAPTGRAAKRLGELCGREGATLHRLLETRYDPQSGRLAFAKGEDDPLDADVVIVDETSMVDITLARALLSALRGDCRVIFVGDADQLPSVGPGNVFSDLIRSGIAPVVRLTEVFRQAAESAIVRNAHGVNRGEAPDLHNKSKDFFFLRRTNPEQAVETIVELVQTRLPERMGIPADQIQVLSPTRKRQTGTAALNRALQEALNPPEAGRGEYRFGEYIFREHDRVMQVRNNYDLMWYQQEGGLSGMGVFNGDIGQIIVVDSRDGSLTVDFEGRHVVYTSDLLGELEPAYAVTVHKAQGSEYRAVILSVADAPPMLLTRSILYTSITRARELLILVGDERVVARMTANNRQRKRYSGLCYRLAELP
ncbi:MAG: ATP-dependent RecD-like DNA helicase [Oscillospiraceae bacterium]|nr:ATP-dependent RecD-like DNA helicase [Oscillospiraceae bacterium]